MEPSRDVTQDGDAADPEILDGDTADTADVTDTGATGSTADATDSTDTTGHPTRTTSAAPETTPDRVAPDWVVLATAADQLRRAVRAGRATDQQVMQLLAATVEQCAGQLRQIQEETRRRLAALERAQHRTARAVAPQSKAQLCRGTSTGP
jgi:hypothetical protein